MPDRALPGRVIDLIVDGASADDLRTRGTGAVWAALLTTACSAVQRGWSRAEWVEEIMHPRSMLGRQLRLDRRAQARSPGTVQRDLDRAWTRASTWVCDHPPLTRDDIDARIRWARDLASDPDAPIPDTDRAVIAHGCDVGATHGTDRPTMPRRAVAAATGLTVEQVRASLARLDRTGLMVCEVRGVPGGPRAARRRASAYRLPSPASVARQAWGPTYLPGCRSVGGITTMWGVPDDHYVGGPVG